MITFTNLKTGEVKTAFSFRIDGEKTYITFTEGGKEYGYSSANVKIHDEDTSPLPFKVYFFKKECYRCHRNTNILTYITFSDDTTEDLIYPWDKNRLMKCQSMEQVLAHMADPTIEYYGLNVVGDNPEYDKMLLQKYPHQFKNTFSQTVGSTYLMNVCEHPGCGAGQGRNFVYRRVNELIQQMKEIEIVE